MKILILGSTGRTGQLLVRQAIEQDHEVTAYARDSSSLGQIRDRITIIEGDVLDRNKIVKALEGKEAVLSALGAGRSLRSNNLITKAATVLVPAMETANVKRLVFLSAFGVGESYSQANFIQKIIFSTFLRNIYADKSKGEEIIRSSNLDWTLIYPVILTNAPGKSRYLVGEKLQMKGMPKVSRADVAEFMLRQLTDNRSIKKTMVIMN